MAVVLGTNGGFVTIAPSADPAGAGWTIDSLALVTGDTSDVTATRITEVGWWCDGATEEANFEVGVYEDDGGVPGVLLHSDIVNAKGTDAGWKRVTGLNWAISAGTKYWIAAQLDNTTPLTQTNYVSSGGGGYDEKVGQASLPNPYDGGVLQDNNGVMTIYAIWDTGAPPVGAAGIMTTNSGYWGPTF